MIYNPPKCKEIIFRKKGFIQDIAQVNNIPQSTELPILGVTFQENCKYSEHVRAKLIKANKCLFVLRSLRKEGFSQGEVDHLFSALVLQNFLGRCFKRKYPSKRMDTREPLEKADKKPFKVSSVDPNCPLSTRGALGYFLGGYVPHETPNWHPVLKKNSPKIDTPF